MPDYVSYKAWCGCAMTTSPPRPRQATNSARCWMRTGPGPRPCSLGWAHRSRWPSSPTTPPPNQPLDSVKLAWPPSCAATLTAAARQPSNCWPDFARHPPRPPGCHPRYLARLLAAQIQLLRTLLATITQLEAEIKRIVTTHPRARLLQQLPGIGQLNLAQILAEIGPILDRVDNAEQAAAECGATPVTKASGKTTGVYFRWAANTRARKAITAFAHNSRMQSRWAQGLYRDARARGKRNPHATRIVARSWIRVIWTCWHTNPPTTPSNTPPNNAPPT
jgi:type II secretory pathway component PulJ